MSDALYHDRIVALAKSRAGAGKLEAPTASARRDNPLCGDRVTMDVRLDDQDRIVELAHQVRGCALCQASAVALAARATGLPKAEIGALRAEIWFAPQLRYLPVRIRIEQDAETYVDLVLARRPEIAAGP